MMQVLPGQYAFVLHTASPFSGERGEMYGELVCGLGETLVGNHPGRPLAFSDRPDGSDMQVRTKFVCRTKPKTRLTWWCLKTLTVSMTP